MCPAFPCKLFIIAYSKYFELGKLDYLGAWQPSEGFQFQGDVPDQDVDENSAQQPTAPLEQPKIDAVVSGYEKVAYSSEGNNIM